MTNRFSKAEWIEQYGGQALLDREGFEVVPCVNCDDSICHGWRVQKRPPATTETWYEAQQHTGGWCSLIYDNRHATIDEARERIARCRYRVPFRIVRKTLVTEVVEA